MLSGGAYDLFIQRLIKTLSGIKVADGRVWLDKDALAGTITVCVSFAIYGKPHRVATVFTDNTLRRLPAGVKFYDQLYQEIITSVASYLNAVDRTETWELVPKT